MADKEYKIRDLTIDDEFAVIKSDASIKEAAEAMKANNVPDLVVIDEKEKVLGVLADFDIVQNVIAESLDPNTVKVVSSMYTITPVTLDTSVTEAFAKLRDLEVSVVPVVENNKLKGVATIQDLWSYIPDDVSKDEIGLIKVSNPKMAEFWLTGVFSLIALIFGILLPLMGLTGFINVDGSLLTRSASISGDFLISLIFARGTDTMFFLTNYMSNDIIWLLIVLWNVVLLLIGIIGTFSLIIASYSDTKNVKPSGLISKYIPLLFLFSLIITWVIYYIGLANYNPSIDLLGLISSIIAIICIFLALFRDKFFRHGDTEVKE